jgi:hypothetical protein
MDRKRHNVNLSRQVWGELKLRAFQEGMSASELVAYLVERFTKEGYKAIVLPRYQPRSSDDDRLGRTVFVPADVWQSAQERAASFGTSISGLIEYLARQYLGRLPEAEDEPQRTASNTVRIGEERVYLGENPVKFDLNTGKPIEDEKKM